MWLHRGGGVYHNRSVSFSLKYLRGFLDEQVVLSYTVSLQCYGTRCSYPDRAQGFYYDFPLHVTIFVSCGHSSLPSDSVPVVEDSVPFAGRVYGYGPLVSSPVVLSMNLTELLGTPFVCASPFLSVDEPSSM